jgi:alpha-glucosidase
VFVAEAWVDGPARLARYVRRDELHTAFNFDFVRAPWKAAALRATIDTTMAEHEAVGAPPTWVLSNHDVARHVSRFGRPQPDGPAFSADDLHGPLDLDLGVRRARAAALLMLALPGGAYVYQGEELGLPEVEDLPEEVLQDPTWERSGRIQRGRDGCRVPLPWHGTEPPYGFSRDGAAPPWLPQPELWRERTVEALQDRPGSILRLYQDALRLRRTLPALGDGMLRWLDAPEGALAFARDPGFTCVVNLTAGAVPLPEGAEVLLSSAEIGSSGGEPGGGTVGPDTAVWLRTAG